jgi:hypothetical protein
MQDNMLETTMAGVENQDNNFNKYFKAAQKKELNKGNMEIS